MTKQEFIDKIRDILLIEEEVDMSYSIKIDSLASLMMIEFFDEKFGYRLTSETLSQIKSILPLFRASFTIILWVAMTSQL